MLYEEKLKLYDDEVKNSVDELFTVADKYQSHYSDLLLIIIHCFFNEDAVNWNNPNIPKLSPFVFGSGNEGLMLKSQNEFFHAYFNMYIIKEDEPQELKIFKEGNGPILNKSAIIQMELMFYLKSWEADLFLKILYNLSRLTHGKNYDWHKKLKDTGRTNLITENIRNMTKVTAPTFYNLIDSIYSPQIRNAIAHSKYWIASDGIKFFNYDPSDKLNTLIGITFIEWEVIFHKTILLYNHIFVFLQFYHNRYQELAKDKHFGHQIRINRKDGSIVYDWLRYNEPEGWMWYSNYSKYYLKRFHIIIK